ncbi:MAG: chemotaxis protein CheW, partial [Acetobacteraceae bacterium]
PLTLAIVSALVVQAGSERFAIPQISVVELVRAGRPGETGAENVIERINDTEVLRLRDRLLPLVNLADLLELEGSGEASIIVVAQVGADLLGIVVDRVFDTEEIVVKPVAPILRHITVFSGNTILGDGSVIMILDPNGIARATGIAAAGEGRAGRREAEAGDATNRRATAMLLFRAGGRQPLAVPLALVSRLEEIPRERIEATSGPPVVQYRGRLMKLVSLSDTPANSPNQAVLVFADGDRSTGLMVDEIVDVVEDHAEIELVSGRAGLLGTAVIGGSATDVIDTEYWLGPRG